jgi:hypothetical protein
MDEQRSIVFLAEQKECVLSLLANDFVTGCVAKYLPRKSHNVLIVCPDYKKGLTVFKALRCRIEKVFEEEHFVFFKDVIEYETVDRLITENKTFIRFASDECSTCGVGAVGNLLFIDIDIEKDKELYGCAVASTASQPNPNIYFLHTND